MISIQDAQRFVYKLHFVFVYKSHCMCSLSVYTLQCLLNGHVYDQGELDQAERTYLCTTIASLLESTCSLLSFIGNICNAIIFHLRRVAYELYFVLGDKNFG